MNKSDKERLKKIIRLWNTLNEEIEKRGITRELLLEDQFSQWAVTTPIYNIGEQAQQSVFHLHFHVLSGRDMTWPPG